MVFNRSDQSNWSPWSLHQMATQGSDRRLSVSASYSRNTQCLIWPSMVTTSKTSQCFSSVRNTQGSNTFMLHVLQTCYNSRGTTVNSFLYVRFSINTRTRECKKERSWRNSPTIRYQITDQATRIPFQMAVCVWYKLPQWHDPAHSLAEIINWIGDLVWLRFHDQISLSCKSYKALSLSFCIVANSSSV